MFKCRCSLMGHNKTIDVRWKDPTTIENKCVCVCISPGLQWYVAVQCPGIVRLPVVILSSFVPGIQRLASGGERAPLHHLWKGSRCWTSAGARVGRWRRRGQWTKAELSHGAGRQILKGKDKKERKSRRKRDVIIIFNDSLQSVHFLREKWILLKNRSDSIFLSNSKNLW